MSYQSFLEMQEQRWNELNKQSIKLREQGNYSEAVRFAEQALVLVRQLWGESHLHVAASLNNLAALYEDQGRYGEAEPLYLQALELRKRLLGQEHPHVAASLNNLAALYCEQGRYSDAEPLLKQALELRQRYSRPRNSPPVPATVSLPEPQPPTTKPQNSPANSSFRLTLSTRFLGETVAKMLGVSPYLGTKAVEPCLSKHQSPRILLIATHGFFLPNSPHNPPKTPPYQWQENTLFTSNRLSAINTDDPMLRSGLAFAGANTWNSGGTLPPEAGKSVIFAKDIAALDLWATELVVLSACNTAMGDIKMGEGVFGLRRAFAVAGAKTLVMSLWSVPDQATALLMQRFFTNLQQGLGRAAALQDAQNYIRTVTVKQLQQSDLGRSILKELIKWGHLPQDLQYCQEDRPLKHPYYWGAWVCQGDTTAVE